MRYLFLAVSLLFLNGRISAHSPDFSLVNKDSIILTGQQLDSIWEIAVDEYQTDSCSIVINCSFWRDLMPGADNTHTCWNVTPSDKLFYGGLPPRLEIISVYFFASMDNKGYKYDYFSYDNERGWKKDHKFYFRPAGVIVVLFNSYTSTFLLLKKTGAFHLGTVE